jgi:hypothetical protein
MIEALNCGAHLHYFFSKRFVMVAILQSATENESAECWAMSVTSFVTQTVQYK